MADDSLREFQDSLIVSRIVSAGKRRSEGDKPKLKPGLKLRWLRNYKVYKGVSFKKGDEVEVEHVETSLFYVLGKAGGTQIRFGMPIGFYDGADPYLEPA